MLILSATSDVSTKASVKAYIPNGSPYILDANNHKLSVQNYTASQSVAVYDKQIVSIQYDQKLIAQIFRNSDPV